MNRALVHEDRLELSTFRLSAERSKPTELHVYKTGADNEVRTRDSTLARSCITTILYPHCLAGPERFELPTSSFEDLLSIQLNYGPILVVIVRVELTLNSV